MSEENNVLVSVTQKTVVFYGDDLIAIRAADGQIYVSFRHLCHALGLDRACKVQRVPRHEILAEGYEGGAMMASPGGSQRAGVLRVDLVPLWLSGVDTNYKLLPSKRFQEAMNFLTQWHQSINSASIS